MKDRGMTMGFHKRRPSLILLWVDLKNGHLPHISSHANDERNECVQFCQLGAIGLDRAGREYRLPRRDFWIITTKTQRGVAATKRGLHRRDAENAKSFRNRTKHQSRFQKTLRVLCVSAVNSLSP